MSLRPLSLLRRGLAGVWWFIDAARRTALNLLFLLLIALLLVALFRRESPVMQDNTALVLDLKGPLVEELSGGVRDNALAQLRGNTIQSTRLRDVLAVLEAAATDPQISRVVLILDDFQGGGLASLRDVASALQRFKASGKPVVAWGSGYDQKQYYLAAHASEVLMHPLGAVYLDGFGRLRNYYLDALDKLGVGVSLVKVGAFKSAAEPFIANGPSPAAQEADSVLYNGLWATYTEGIETARQLPPGSTQSLIEALPDRLVAAGGDAARLAIEAKQVDALKTRDELRVMLIERGALDADSKSFRQVSFENYLARMTPVVRGLATGNAIGIVVAEGEIVDGQAPAGTVGGLSTAALVRQAREDDSIKAVVLRVNSPGGSVFGSELVRRELELTRAAGKPVVVSMGSVAASGGYWISTASDEVMADAATVTGSIGVFALLPNAHRAIDKLGVHAEGVTTTWLGAAGDPRREPDPRFIGMLQTSVDHIYADFVGKVAQARQTTPQKIDDVAQGRVWTGLQAKERGLVDTIGGLNAAIRSAAVRAKLLKAGEGDKSASALSSKEPDFRVVYIDREPGRFERLLEAFGGAAATALAAHFDLRLVPAGLPDSVTGPIRHDLGWLVDLVDGRKPFAAVTHCLCDAP
ncbi:MAG: signal peptide peptidase SppA [Burkholderiaceae bacterium]|nr:signal peptide peptidase SppA [Burkholderiaceae bacterium]